MVVIRKIEDARKAGATWSRQKNGSIATTNDILAFGVSQHHRKWEEHSDQFDMVTNSYPRDNSFVISLTFKERFESDR